MRTDAQGESVFLRRPQHTRNRTSPASMHPLQIVRKPSALAGAAKKDVRVPTICHTPEAPCHIVAARMRSGITSAESTCHTACPQEWCVIPSTPIDCPHGRAPVSGGHSLACHGEAIHTACREGNVSGSGLPCVGICSSGGWRM